jgi:hypothetical protein
MTFRLMLGVVGVAFVARYVLAERKLALARERAIAQATRAEIAPWRVWSEWRRHIIEREHSES